MLALPGVELAGLHSHIGSQIYDTAGFEVAAHRVLELAVRIRDEHGIEIGELDLGGGFGIAYTPGDDPQDVKVIADSLREIVEPSAGGGPGQAAAVGEPGRAIAGPGTVTLYEVGTVKDVDGLRTYVSVDGGMSDNIRTALYDAEYTCVLASRESAAAADAVPACRQALRERRHRGQGRLPAADIVPGDLVAVAATGAYCRSMASNYNHVLQAARWLRSGTGPRGCCCAARPSTTCSGWTPGLSRQDQHRVRQPVRTAEIWAMPIGGR